MLKDKIQVRIQEWSTLAMSKAEGNLKFLAEAKMQTMTQGEAVLDALHAIQKARKEYNKILQELSLARDGLYE
ncbi:MAG: hypothetical protein EBY39_02895 [Flavobacteriia bacterium]|nr:hypothetical protein [Flavobacteriia bacterium]